MESDSHPSDGSEVTERIRVAAHDARLMMLRRELALANSRTFSDVGNALHAIGHIVGSDRVRGVSPFGHGSDETVAVSLLLRIAAQLISASTDLFTDGRHYAAAALLRQMVEVEYLAWAIATRDREGERWLRSDRKLRETFFTPARLRKAADGTFRAKDYGYHCELGGHPVPGGSILLAEDNAISQLLLADLLCHIGQIWDRVFVWAERNPNGVPVLKRRKEIVNGFTRWKALDPLSALPPPD